MATGNPATVENRHGERLLVTLVVAALVGALSVTDSRAILEPIDEADPSASAAAAFVAQGPVTSGLSIQYARAIGGPATRGFFGRGGPAGFLPGAPPLLAPAAFQPGPPALGAGPFQPGLTTLPEFGPIGGFPIEAPGPPGLPQPPYTFVPAVVPDGVDPNEPPGPVVPEPATWALLIGGFLGTGMMLRRARRMRTA